MKDGAPDWHLPGTMCRHDFVAHNHFAHVRRRKLPSIIPGQESQIGHPNLQRGCRWPRSFGVHAVAGGTIGPEQVWSFDRANQRRKLLFRIRGGLSLLAGSTEDNASEHNCQRELRGPLESLVCRPHRSLFLLQRCGRAGARSNQWYLAPPTPSFTVSARNPL